MVFILKHELTICRDKVMETLMALEDAQPGSGKRGGGGCRDRDFPREMREDEEVWCKDKSYYW